MYSNIQGVTKKKESLINIMEELNVDICLLAETMTRTFKIDGCRCFQPNKSVGQNVSVVLRNRLIDNDVIKLYEPNETINLLGIRIEMLNSCIRISHLKQQSTSQRDEIPCLNIPRKGVLEQTDDWQPRDPKTSPHGSM